MIYIIILILIALDQFSKYLTVEYLKPVGTHSLIDGIISLTYAENTGAAFSMLEGKIWFFAIVTFAALAFMYYFYKKDYIKHTFGKIALILISAGAIGNLIDRLIHGYVVDMFELTFMNFAIFNVADIFITLGGVVLCYYIIFQYDKDNPKEKINE